MEDQYKSTGLADAHRVIFTTKVYIRSSNMSDEDVEFEVLNLNKEISQLRSHIHTKASNKVSCPTDPSTTHDSTVEATESTMETTESSYCGSNY